jgi:hypothetical protein
LVKNVPNNNLTGENVKFDGKYTDRYQKTFEVLQKIIPKKFKDNAALILDFALENPRIDISDSHELIVDKNKIANSNIIDIISDISRPRKSIAPSGSEALVNVLLNSNVPKELFINKNRLSKLKSNSLYAAPDLDTSSESDEPPKKTPKKQKGGSLFLKAWTNL